MIFLEPVGVRLAVHELQRIGRRYIGEHLLEAPRVHKLLDARVRPDGEMVLAVRADEQPFLDHFAEQHPLAFGAAHPQPFGDAFRLPCHAVLRGNLGHLTPR